MRHIDADGLKEQIRQNKFLSDWYIDEILKTIDSMPTAGSQPAIIYQTMIPINPRAKKNNQKIVRNRATNAPVIVQSDIYKQYEKDCGWFIKPPVRPISGPVNIQCIFYRDTARRCDLTNLLEAIDDILVKYKVITDDNFNVLAAHDGSRVYVDRFNPRTEIIITSAEV